MDARGAQTSRPRDAETADARTSQGVPGRWGERRAALVPPPEAPRPLAARDGQPSWLDAPREAPCQPLPGAGASCSPASRRRLGRPVGVSVHRFGRDVSGLHVPLRDRSVQGCRADGATQCPACLLSINAGARFRRDRSGQSFPSTWPRPPHRSAPGPPGLAVDQGALGGHRGTAPEGRLPLPGRGTT